MAKGKSKQVPVEFFRQLLQSVMGGYKGTLVRAGANTAKAIGELSTRSEDPLTVGTDEWVQAVTRLNFALSVETLRLMTITTPPMTGPDAQEELFVFLGITKKED